MFFVFRDSYVIYIWVMNILCLFHIFMYGYVTVRPSPNKRPEYDTKQSDGETPVILELWGMGSTPSLPLLPDPLWPRMVALDRVLSMGQIELCTNAKLNCLK